MRCAIPIVLALAIARPMLQQDTALGSSTAPVHHVLVFDQSYSMKLALEGSTSPYERARTLAQELLERAADRQAGRRVSLVLAGVRPMVPFREETDLQRAKARIAALPPPADSAAQLTDALLEVADLVEETATGSEVRVHLFTDLQARALGDLGLAAAEEVVESPTAEQAVPEEPTERMFADNAADALARIRARAELDVFDVRGSSDSGVEDNLQVIDVEVGVGHAIRSVPMPIVATVLNRTDRAQAVQVTLEIDDSQPIRRATSIEAGAEGEVVFETVFHELGQRRITASIDSDGLTTDDRRHRVVEVRDRLRLLVVEGSAEDDPSLRESTHLLEILDPTGGEGPPDLTQFAPTVVDTVTFLAGRADPADYDLVVLANVERLSDEVARSIDTAVRSGVGLFVMLGSDINLDSYNLHLHAAGEGPMPILLEREEGFATGGDRYHASSILERDHPVFRDFTEDVYFELFQGLPVWRFIAASVPPAPESEGAERDFDVLATVNDARQHPLLVAGRHGAGKTLILTSAISRKPERWNRLDASIGGLSFLFLWPVAQWLTLPAQDDRNIEVGGVLTAALRERPTDLAVVPPEQSGTGKIPVGEEPRPVAGERYALPPFRRTDHVGYYEFEMLLGEDVGNPHRHTELFAVNADMAEGELAYLSHEAARERLGVDTIRTSLPTASESVLESGVDELGPTLLLATLLFVLGEAVLARWISGRSS
jgi:hypothetical protein